MTAPARPAPSRPRAARAAAAVVVAALALAVGLGDVAAAAAVRHHDARQAAARARARAAVAYARQLAPALDRTFRAGQPMVDALAALVARGTSARAADVLSAYDALTATPNLADLQAATAAVAALPAPAPLAGVEANLHEALTGVAENLAGLRGMRRGALHPAPFLSALAAMTPSWPAVETAYAAVYDSRRLPRPGQLRDPVTTHPAAPTDRVSWVLASDRICDRVLSQLTPLRPGELATLPAISAHYQHLTGLALAYTTQLRAVGRPAGDAAVAAAVGSLTAFDALARAYLQVSVTTQLGRPDAFNPAFAATVTAEHGLRSSQVRYDAAGAHECGV